MVKKRRICLASQRCTAALWSPFCNDGLVYRFQWCDRDANQNSAYMMIPERTISALMESWLFILACALLTIILCSTAAYTRSFEVFIEVMWLVWQVACDYFNLEILWNFIVKSGTLLMETNHVGYLQAENYLQSGNQNLLVVFYPHLSTRLHYKYWELPFNDPTAVMRVWKITRTEQLQIHKLYLI